MGSVPLLFLGTRQIADVSSSDLQDIGTIPNSTSRCIIGKGYPLSVTKKPPATGPLEGCTRISKDCSTYCKVRFVSKKSIVFLDNLIRTFTADGYGAVLQVAMVALCISANEGFPLPN
jgi:hypothetical protein